MTNELGKVTNYAYDNLNRLVLTTDSLGGRTTFGYDANGNRTLVQDPVGNRTTNTYDALNRVTNIQDPLGNSATFMYDAASRMTSTFDRLGRRPDFTYDNDNRKIFEQWFTSNQLVLTQAFTWDAVGNMLTAQDPHGNNTFTYDDLNRVSTVAEPFGLSLTYTYDSADNRTVVQDSKGGTETRTYDAANRATNVKFTGNSAAVSFALAYTVRDQLAGITRYSDATGTNKIGSTSFTYDDRGRTTNIWHKDGRNSDLHQNVGGSLATTSPAPIK